MAAVVAAAAAVVIARVPLHCLNGGDHGTGCGDGRGRGPGFPSPAPGDACAGSFPPPPLLIFTPEDVAVVVAEVAAFKARLLSAACQVSPANDLNGWSYLTRLPPHTAGVVMAPGYARRPSRRRWGRRRCWWTRHISCGGRGGWTWRSGGEGDGREGRPRHLHVKVPSDGNSRRGSTLGGTATSAT